MMLFAPRPLPATFLSRPNRFLGIAELDGQLVECFIPNPGRLRELLQPGARVYLQERRDVGRKTGYNLILAEKNGVLVSVDSMAPNRVVGEALGSGLITEMGGLSVVRREPTYGGSRLDFLLGDGSARLLLEVKSCTLVEEGVALFPDAPTERGARHLKTLESFLGEGRASVLFLIQRSDAGVFRPNGATDPRFASALREAVFKGVEVYAYDSTISLGKIKFNRRVPVDLDDNLRLT